MKTMLRFAVLALVSTTALAAENAIFTGYETVRQSLLKGDVAIVQKSATAYAATARAANQNAIAAKAEALSKATDLAKARNAFGALSDEVIKYRASLSGDKPAVVYCAMEKKSWLQAAGTPISNPYLDSGMRTCGELVKDEAAQQQQHHH